MIQDPDLTGVMISNLSWLTDAQMERLRPFAGRPIRRIDRRSGSLPTSRGRRQVDGRSVPGWTIFVRRTGLRGCDAPPGQGPAKTPCNRPPRRSRAVAFARIMEGPAPGGGEEKVVMTDATCPRG